MSITEYSKENRRYGFFVLLTIILTFLAVISAIYFTVKPLMTHEEDGRVSGSINTFTNFYVDNTSKFRNVMQDTVNYYKFLLDYPDSAIVLCRKMRSINESIAAVSITYLESGLSYTSRDSLSNINLDEIKTDSLMLDSIRGKRFSTTLIQNSGRTYYLSCYPFFNSSDEPSAVATIIIDMQYFSKTFERHNPYKEGKLYLLYDVNTYAIIEKDMVSIGKSPVAWAETTYGHEAYEVILKAFCNPNKEGFIAKSNGKYLFAKYENLYYYMFFYVVDRKYVSDDMRPSLYVLLVFCIMGGLVILRTCMKNMRLISMNARHEEQQRKDLETAASIQRSMLPPEGLLHMSVDIGSKLIPAKGVGGDLFYHWIRNGRLFFCIGDISGKGIPASLYMSKTVSLFHIISSHDYSPSTMASKLNEELCLNNENGVFLTLFIGILDLKTHMLDYCNAGHDEPIYWDGSKEHKPQYLKTSINCPIGFEEETEFFGGSFQLSKDYLLVFYTDGINEAKSDSLDMFGLDRLLNSVTVSKEMCSDDINKAIIKDVSKFVKKHEQSDDMTLLTLRHHSSCKSITIKNTRKQLKKLGAFLKDIFNEAGIKPEEIGKLRRGIDEAMTNVVSYAYDGEGSITLNASIDNSALTFVIMDYGKEFDPLKHESEPEEFDPDKIGGLGISIVKQSFDILDYKREGNANVLKLIKYI